MVSRKIDMRVRYVRYVEMTNWKPKNVAAGGDDDEIFVRVGNATYLDGKIRSKVYDELKNFVISCKRLKRCIRASPSLSARTIVSRYERIRLRCRRNLFAVSKRYYDCTLPSFKTLCDDKLSL